MDRRAAAIRSVQQRLGHVFADQALLDRALTHASAGSGAVKIADNERLEFLGDRVLGLAIAHALMLRDGEAQAGALARPFAHLVSRASCARIARELGLGEALLLPGGESRQGARQHETILADACEAVIAALYLEVGFERAAAAVVGLWRPLLEEPFDPSATNPKTALQEWAAARGHPPPQYRTLSRIGPDHGPTFRVEAAIPGQGETLGEGGSLQTAQKSAALALLQHLKALA